MDTFDLFERNVDMAERPIHWPVVAEALGEMEPDERIPLDDFLAAVGRRGLYAMDIGENGWWEQALCAQTDPVVFYPSNGAQATIAKRICNSCEVRNECLDYAIVHAQRLGIWGGVPPRPRAKLIQGYHDA